jgi:hypothetical protein
MLTRWKELKKHTKWIDHTKSVAVGVRTLLDLLAMALHHVISICVKTRWKPQQRLYVKRCLAKTVPISSGRRGKMTDRHALEPLFFGHVKPKKHHFHITKWSKQTTICNWHKIKNKKHNSSVPKPHAGHIFYHRSCAQMITPPRAVSVGRDVVFVCCDIEFNILRVSWVSYMSCVLTANHQLLTCLL